eukprot:CAMPEP_0174241434 /NCGR_PEP_ID=MMETSP0417-20130205/23422_1 /TAXON_ID=242541 /ORGANISM="Mayorella sp, Strain BSH-02190019" /LENGTH=320 /DNA_ID=CAMNT_0015320675 /DNA_START=32 /DNA_END=990 /DNA_ORIENTATION=+
MTTARTRSYPALHTRPDWHRAGTLGHSFGLRRCFLVLLLCACATLLLLTADGVHAAQQHVDADAAANEEGQKNPSRGGQEINRATVNVMDSNQPRGEDAQPQLSILQKQRQQQLQRQRAQQAGGHTHSNNAVDHRGYKMGEVVRMECRMADGSWGPGPTCVETGMELTFPYGVDRMMTCGLPIASNVAYEHLKQLINRNESWACRLRMLPEVDFFIPFYIPIWGVAEATHVHVDNHMNFVFHGGHGRIIGVSAYPVRDHFVFGAKGSIIPLHGPVKWFHGAGFTSLSSNAFRADAGPSPVGLLVLMFIWCSLTAILTTLG